jgi:GTP 3',8-cyclase
LRLTPTGMLRPCLFSDIEFDIRKLGAQKAIEAALAIKPIKGGHNYSGSFYNIGG